MCDLGKADERNEPIANGDMSLVGQRIQAGRYFGYLPPEHNGNGSWFVRVYDKRACRYHQKNLGSFGGMSEHEVFTTVKAEAEKFAEEVEAGEFSSRDINDSDDLTDLLWSQFSRAEAENFTVNKVDRTLSLISRGAGPVLFVLALVGLLTVVI
ncbi:hypothetical protein [Qipengyuania sp. MTN3-11]|uniref:hypothetical protein n=1 Tax=Qipengyuania sp. MTN3-11 TaxID=3056557 RepID=UPI0036F22E32